MKKIKRLNVIHTPLNLSKSLVVQGGSLTQIHCAETDEYIPDRSITPLVILPRVYVQDPDGILPPGLAALSGVAWYALPEDVAASVPDGSYIVNELSQYLITGATPGYHVQVDGSLRVEANIQYPTRTVLVFTGNIPDARSGRTVKVQESVLLSTTSIALPATLSLDKPASWRFNPVEDTGIRTIKASLMLGGKAPDPNHCSVAFWWYKASGNSVVLLDPDEDLFYESGQGTDTLVIDPAYLEEERIICKAEYALDGASLPVSPTANCLTAETVIGRRYPAYDFENYVHGGVEVAPNASHVKNECVVTIGQKVIDNPSRFFTVIWSIKEPVYGAEWRILGYGDSIMIPKSEISGGADVGLEVEELAPMGAMSDNGTDSLTDDEGNILTF